MKTSNLLILGAICIVITLCVYTCNDAKYTGTETVDSTLIKAVHKHDSVENGLRSKIDSLNYKISSLEEDIKEAKSRYAKVSRKKQYEKINNTADSSQLIITKELLSEYAR